MRAVPGAGAARLGCSRISPYLVVVHSWPEVHRGPAHDALLTLLKLPATFVVHSLRHTALTRLGESGAGAFTIMQIAGHSSVTVSQRYVHPSPESLETAFAALDALTETKRNESVMVASEAAVAEERRGLKSAANLSVPMRWARSSTGRATDS